MHFTLRITGAAGLGINSLADITGNMLSHLGYYVTGDLEYESRIKGGTNWFDLNISDTRPSVRRTIDVLLAYDIGGLKKSITAIREGGFIIANAKLKEKFTPEIESAIAERKLNFLSIEITDKYENVYLLGILVKLLGIDASTVHDEIRMVFGKKGEEVVSHNIGVVDTIYASYELGVTSPWKMSSQGVHREFTYGNKIIALGAVDSELEYYSAYPMTPASSVLTEIIASGKVPYLQAEDEIAVMNSALGAAFTGARAMVGTSGGGFALMTEGLSFAAQAEFPIVALLSQRAGPSTGTPTFHEQGEIRYALVPTFGEFGHVVLCPSSFHEAYLFAGLALNIAQKYQTIVILLTDKQFSELHSSYDALPPPTPVDRGKLLETPSPDYKRYELTEDGISPYVKVGTENGDFIATSYEHDEYGATTESPELKGKMTEKRAKKLDNFFEKEGYRGYEMVNGGAKKIIVTLSANRIVAEDFIAENPEYGLMVIKFLLPVDTKIRDELIGKDEVIFMEGNYSGQLEEHLVRTLDIDHIDGLKISNFRKYTLYPFYREEMDERFKK
ncbi:MAG: 2-oxoacid:acceptor oxidoreductase subunit alpha [Candidatus Altimarinota bacterium]